MFNPKKKLLENNKTKNILSLCIPNCFYLFSTVATVYYNLNLSVLINYLLVIRFHNIP